MTTTDVLTTLLLLRADGTTSVILIGMPTKPGYANLMQLLRPHLESCGPRGGIDHVTVWLNGTRTDMFVDEMGHDKGLPHNALATTVYRNSTMVRSPGTDPRTLPDIVGDAVLFGRQVWF